MAKCSNISYMINTIESDIKKMILGGGSPELKVCTITDYLCWLKKFHKADDAIVNNLLDKITFALDMENGHISNDDYDAFIRNNYPEEAF